MTAGSWRQWWQRSKGWLMDAAPAAFLVAFAMVQIWLPDYAPGVDGAQGNKAALTITALIATAPVAARRRFPLVAFTLALGGMAMQARLVSPEGGLAELCAMLVCAFSVGRRGDRTNALMAVVIGAVLIGVTGENSGDWVFLGALAAGGLGAGFAVRPLQRESERLRARATELARERDEQARIAAAEERSRIARELHDIVAHGVSTMVIQAQAGASLLANQPDRAGHAFEAIEAGGRQALTELRNLLGMLRELEDTETLEPQPTVDRVHELVSNARGAGLDVDLLVDGHVVQVSPGFGLAVYRIVQEGLTNTIKHAKATHASVRIQYHPDAVELELTDNGTSRAQPRAGGHGLVGMRERAAIYHGSVVSGPRPEGGYLVRVRLPMEVSDQ